MKNIIYCLIDPFTSEIRYVGKTKQKLENRLTKHIHYAKKNNIHVSNWIKTILVRDSKPIIKIIEELPEDIDWRVKEIYYIKLYKSLGFNLTNLTDGGEGQLGYKKIGKPHTQETKNKIGKANKAIIKTKDWIEKAAAAQYIPIYGLHKENNSRIEFISLKHTALYFGNIKYRKNIGLCLKNKRPTAYGYKWFYKNKG